MQAFALYSVCFKLSVKGPCCGPFCSFFNFLPESIIVLFIIAAIPRSYIIWE